MMEVIDTIYKKEADYTEDNVKAIRKDIKSWANYQPYPSNVQARFIKRGREREKEAKRKEAETLLNVPIDLGAETSAQKIQRLFGIDPKKETVGLDMSYQMSNFCTNENAFYKFKHGSTIGRTLKNYQHAALQPNTRLTRAELLIHEPSSTKFDNGPLASEIRRLLPLEGA